MPIYTLRDLAADGFLKGPEAKFLSAVRRHNPLLFDFSFKRLKPFYERRWGSNLKSDLGVGHA